MNEDKTRISKEILFRLGINATRDQMMIKCLSPEHDDHHASMSVSLRKGVCHCFACGYSASLASLYYERTGNSIYRDLGIEQNPEDLIIRASRSIPRSRLPDQVLDVDFSIDGTFTSMSEDAQKWIKARGFDVQFCVDQGWRYASHLETFRVSDPSDEDGKGYYSGMVIIPIYEHSHLVSFEARDIHGKEAWEKRHHAEGAEYKKVLYPRFSSVNTLFGWETLNKNQTLYVVEGLMDMFSLRTSATFKNCSCLFHCIPTERQLGILDRFHDIVYVTDNDAPGLRGCLKMMESLKGKVSYLQVPDRDGRVKDINDILQGKDPYIKTVDGLLRAGWLDRISDDADVLKQKISILVSQLH